MTTLEEAQAKEAQEIWETTTGGAVYVNVRDPRNPLGWIQKKVGGKGTKRITLSIAEREFNQDLITYENEHLDPFSNGLLICVQPKREVRAKNDVTDAELIEKLKVEDDGAFEAYFQSVDSEIILRRLLGLAEKNASLYRFNNLKEYVDGKFAIGKTQRVVQEMYDDDSKYSGADL